MGPNEPESEPVGPRTASPATLPPTLGTEPPPWPTPPPAPVEASPDSGVGSPRRGRPALVGALVGAIVGALVAVGTMAVVDDDVTRPAQLSSAPLTKDGEVVDIQAILAKVQPSVVAIETSQATSRGVFEGAGSGIILSADGLILTNAHVIGNIAEITVVLPDGSDHRASLIGASPDDDMALIKVSGVDGLVAAELGSSDALQVGDEVIAIGNALNLGGEPTVTRGIVSATDRDLQAEGVSLEGLIQTDAAINPGNSGGPLVNTAGEVVGMNTAIVADAQNLGFSIAIDRAKPIIEDLKAGNGTVTPGQAFLGVSSSDVSDLSDAVRTRFGIADDAGAFVSEVVPGSAAADGGIEVGDVIVRIGSTAVDQASDVRDAVLERSPGDEVSVTVVRDGEELTLEVILGQRSDRR